MVGLASIGLTLGNRVDQEAFKCLKRSKLMLGKQRLRLAGLSQMILRY